MQSVHIHTVKVFHLTEHDSYIKNVCWKSSWSLLTLIE